MAGMRDKLIHDYLDVDIDAVWDAVERDIPVLKNELKYIIEKEENQSNHYAQTNPDHRSVPV
ncbi:MAG: HepT-like ribonuclease domain-containing protein [bacterium]